MRAQQDASALDLLSSAGTIHFVGIGGIGMSALAELLAGRGKKVTGSDVRSSSVTERLAAMGIPVRIGHAAESVAGADLVVATSAARPDNEEIQEAERRGIPVVKRAEVLGWLMRESFGFAVAGTHGKTTTTGMLAFLLSRSGLDPSALIGGEPLDFPSHGLLGSGPYLVAEADEFDRSFLRLWPKVAVITSIEADHLDCYADLDDIVDSFTQFATRVPSDGLLVTCADDPILRQMRVDVPRQSYGLSEDADWRAVEISPISPFGTRLVFETPTRIQQGGELRLSGQHYALDALAAIAAAAHVGVDPADAIRILGEFHGTRRRFELVGEAAGVTVLDDYAHHPTAVRATLKAARERHQGRLWCVFQPHTVNRTEALLSQFAQAFADADMVLMLPIYQPAGREEKESVSSHDLVARMRHGSVRLVGGLAEASIILEAESAPGDMIITMGAGDVYKVAEHVLCRLRKRGGNGEK